MFEFHKYPSIDNSYRTRTINEIYKHGFHKQDWVVLLKVHGANFSLWTDGETLKPAKRSSFIGDNENFCNYQSVVDAVKDNIKKAFKILNEKYNCSEVVFYGELAGGEYPHPKVEKFPNAKRVQKGVFYAPFNFFYIFDIVVDGKYIDHDEVLEICWDCGLIVAEPLAKGTFDDCIKYPNEFEDPLHKYFGLPSIDDNICEGVVIKPNKACFFGNGSRCILKNKNEKFSEKNSSKKKIKKPKEPMSNEGEMLQTVLESYVTENRLRNVLSHGIVIGQKDFGVLMKEMNVDVWDDFIKDNGDRYKCLEPDEQKIIKKSLNKMTANLIRPHFQDIVDGEF